MTANVEVKVSTLDVVPLHENIPRKYSTRCRGITRFNLHAHAFICEWYAFASQPSSIPVEAGLYLPTLER